MKKILTTLLLLISFISCTNDNNTSNPSAPSNTGNVDYEFTVTINGVVHKVKGNTHDFISQYSSNYWGYNPNFCLATLSTSAGIMLKISDITQKNYISGQTLDLQISIPNCQLGKNEATLQFLNCPVLDQFDKVKNTGGLFIEKSGTYCYSKSSSCQFPYMGDYVNKITMNITDLGTTNSMNTTNLNTGNFIKYGNTFKGNYSGTVYFSNIFSPLSNPSPIFNIPMQLIIDFKAIRNN